MMKFRFGAYLVFILFCASFCLCNGLLIWCNNIVKAVKCLNRLRLSGCDNVGVNICGCAGLRMAKLMRDFR